MPAIAFLPAWLSTYTGLTTTQSLVVNREDIYNLGFNASYSTPMFGVSSGGQFFVMSPADSLRDFA